MELPPELADLDSAVVFEKVGLRLDSEAARALWRKIHDEIEAAGVKSVRSYLETLIEARRDKSLGALDKYRDLRDG